MPVEVVSVKKRSARTVLIRETERLLRMLDARWETTKPSESTLKWQIENVRRAIEAAR
jgi:hypothetical protein